ncbi:ribosome small subunit-dependent GTPase A [Anaeromicropila herbilytica]|uniref:Small ribosomal subunit biogenesis GTPase RsgA n=1 Tax=Anaeromicropila herbilytica TaxID=2785025 RepID=A0A7R7IDH8_9FIRM|nr:ribosome small subunit-dependent GTPase A [Anaeromicropila herbilytica]BCN31567.1 putative ribosome biogenesis GTPase RsgA [Anaeromicropila herbilytica]
MQGKIIKGIAGFYYIHTPYMGVYECKAKGIFRSQKIKPLVGDNVDIDVIDESNKKGNIVKILERKNQLIRPMVSNVDQAIIIFAVSSPKPNLNLLDRFLIMMLKEGVNTIICFNKSDLVSEDEFDNLSNIYRSCGYQVIGTSTVLDEGIQAVQALLEDKTTVLAGPSGVGKSSLINQITPNANMETGAISDKIQRGKHTTRHSELHYINETSYIMDTPGFSSLYLDGIECNELKDYFSEFTEYEEGCRYKGCIHINEPDCRVKDALELGEISEVRYRNYVTIYQELKDQRKY